MSDTSTGGSYRWGRLTKTFYRSPEDGELHATGPIDWKEGLVPVVCSNVPDGVRDDLETASKPTCPECLEIGPRFEWSDDWDTERGELITDGGRGGKGRLEGEYTYTPNGCSPIHHDDTCSHDGCEDDAEWQVDFLVDGNDIKNGHASFPYCDDHVSDYFGYHPDNPEIRTDGGEGRGGYELGDYLGGLPHKVVNEFDAGRGLSMRRVELDVEDGCSVDIVLSDRHLRVAMETDGTEASELAWDGRTTFHDPDAVETFAEELLHAAEWMREQGGDDG